MSVADAVEECVTNAIRHGKADTVKVRCRDIGDAIEATISDNGTWQKHLNPVKNKNAGASRPTGIGFSWLNHISGGDWDVRESAEGTTLVLRIRF
jgi:anti-sigma regulatory factor (Ser/Thr protein kinase)